MHGEYMYNTKGVLANVIYYVDTPTLWKYSDPLEALISTFWEEEYVQHAQ